MQNRWVVISLKVIGSFANVGKQGGEWRKQVGSINEESQVSGCYNITFIYTNAKYCRLSTESDNRQQLKKQPASAGTLGAVSYTHLTLPTKTLV